MQDSKKAKKLIPLDVTGVFADKEPKRDAWSPTSRRVCAWSCMSLSYTETEYADEHVGGNIAVHVNTFFGKLS